MGEKCLDLRAEVETAALHRVVEGLDPVAVPSQGQGVGDAIPNREGEHAIEPVDARDPPCGEGVEQDLRIGARDELIPQGLQLSPQLLKVVDLAVENQDVTPVPGDHGLGPGGAEIDDGEPPVA